MSKLNLSGALAKCSLLSVLLFSACVNEDYDMSSVDNINLEVTPFQDGLTVPLGSTEKIFLKDLLKDVDESILSAGANGAYAVGYSDSFDLSEDLSSLTEDLNIPSLDFSKDISFRFADVNMSDMTVQGRTLPYSYELSTAVASVPDLSVDFDPITESRTILSLKDGYDVPSGIINDTPITLAADIITTNVAFSRTESLPLDITLPKEIQAIRNIKLKPGAGVKVNVELTKSFLQSGELIPDINIDLRNVFHLSEDTEDDIIHLADGLVLSDKNNYKAEQFISITSLALDDEWVKENGSLVLKKNLEIPVTGTIKWNNLMTTTRRMAAEREVNIALNVVFVNIEVADYEVEIEEFSHPLEVSGDEIKIDIPKEIAGVEGLTIYPKGNPVIKLNVDIPEIGVDVVPGAEGIVISFPEMLKFKNVPAEYGYTQTNNSITIRKPLADIGTIALPVDKVVVNPVLDEASGEYYVKGDVTMKGNVGLASYVLTKNQVDNLASAGGDRKINVEAVIPDIEPADMEFENYKTTIKKQVLDLDLFSAEKMPDELVSLGLVELTDTELDLKLDASSFPEMGYGSSMEIHLDVKLPEILKVEGVDENGIYSIESTSTGKTFTFKPIKIKTLDFTGVDIKQDIKDKMEIEGWVRLANTSLDIDQWIGKDLKAYVQAKIEDIVIAKISGKVDAPIKPIQEPIDLEEFTGVLDEYGVEANFDLNKAHLAVEIHTNLAVPVKAALELVPYYDGVADDEKKLNVNLALDAASATDEVTITKFWLADTDKEMPAGYTFVEAKVLDLLRNIPEKIDFTLNAGTDAEKECVLEPNKDYVLKAYYKVELPLEFGEQFEIVYRDTIPDLPEYLGPILATGNKVALAGSLVNTLPLKLEAEFNFLDSNDEVVPAAEGCGTLNIEPCNLDGSASTTKLNMVVGIEKGREDIASLEIIVRATSGGVAGVAVKDDAYLQAVLQAVLPEGVTVDLGEFIKKEENSEDYE